MFFVYVVNVLLFFCLHETGRDPHGPATKFLKTWATQRITWASFSLSPLPPSACLSWLSSALRPQVLRMHDANENRSTLFAVVLAVLLGVNVTVVVGCGENRTFVFSVFRVLLFLAFIPLALGLFRARQKGTHTCLPRGLGTRVGQYRRKPDCRPREPFEGRIALDCPPLPPNQYAGLSTKEHTRMFVSNGGPIAISSKTSTIKPKEKVNVRGSPISKTIEEALD